MPDLTDLLAALTGEPVLFVIVLGALLIYGIVRVASERGGKEREAAAAQALASRSDSDADGRQVVRTADLEAAMRAARAFHENTTRIIRDDLMAGRERMIEKLNLLGEAVQVLRLVIEHDRGASGWQGRAVDEALRSIAATERDVLAAISSVKATVEAVESSISQGRTGKKTA